MRALQGGLGVGLVALLVGAGCGPKIVRESIFQSEQVYVALRRVLDGGETRARGFAHPVTVSDVRLAHVLASLSHKDKKGEAMPTIRSTHVYELAEGLAKALARAGPDDEVLAEVTIGDRHLGIFSNHKVTAFRVTFDATFMRVDFFAIESPLEPEAGRTETQAFKFPLELPKASAGFRLAAGTAQALEGARSVLVDWRDPYYEKPVHLSLRGGRLQRRTILLDAASESDPEDPAKTDVAPLPAELRDGQMRALDQLEAARRSGVVTEAEFQRRRRLVLEGKLAEAGY